MNKQPELVIANAPGTKDFTGKDLCVRQKIISIIKTIFQTMDAVELDTPVIELRSVVDQLYGEEFNKSVYELIDYNNEDDDTISKQILRYDLTVPLARYCAMKGLKVLRRYQIGKVYRRDKPNMINGRYREFYQCDFDIVGDDMGSGINDIEILELLVRTLNKLINKNSYKIKINHRKLLVSLLLKCDVPEEKISTVCSSIDKLDKCGWEEIFIDFQKKGVDIECAIKFKCIVDEFNSYKTINEKLNLLTKFTDENTIFQYLNKLFLMLTELNIMELFKFDLTLARGMDYYTGIIYEAVYLDNFIMPSSIAAGGRYDNMIGKLGNQDNIPAIGLSFGIERLVRIIQSTQPDFSEEPLSNVFVASIGSNQKVINERIKLCSELRAAGLNVVMSNKSNPKMGAQFETVFKEKIKYMIIIGDREIDSGEIKIKEIEIKKETTYKREDGLNFLINNAK